MTDIIADKFLSPVDRAAKARAALGVHHKGLLAWLFAPSEPHAGRPQCIVTGPGRDQKGRGR